MWYGQSFVAIVLVALRAFPGSMAQSTAQRPPSVLVFTKTAGYRHDSIPTAKQVLGDNAGQNNINFTFSEDASLFTDQGLSGFDGIMFVLNSDQILDDDQETALSTYVKSGGVVLSVHSGSACLYEDSTYNQTIGALFDYHPSLQPATFTRINDTHPSTADLPDRWTYDEEVYYWRSDPRSNGAIVVLTVDESSYNNDGTSNVSLAPQGDPHPIAWYIDGSLAAQPLQSGATKAGRTFTTGLGHLNSTWENQTFISHIFGGLTWALEGASTKAYGVGLVGNGGNSTSTNTSSSASAGTSGLATGSSTGSAVRSASASASSSPSSSSGAAYRTLAGCPAAKGYLTATLVIAVGAVAGWALL